jgi:hypothetical protein
MKKVNTIIAALMLLTIQNGNAQKEGYWKRFINHSTLSSTSGIQYRTSSASIGLGHYFSFLQISSNDLQLIENNYGVNIPSSMETSIMGIKTDDLATVKTRVSGLEIQKCITVGLPYIQSTVQWSNQGRMQDPSLFSSPAGLIRLASSLNDKTKLLEQIAAEAVKKATTQPPIFRGRIDMLIELNTFNIVNYKLKQSGSNKKWQFNYNVMPYYIASMDASNNVGLTEITGAKEYISSQLNDIINIPLSANITDVLTGIIDSRIYTPITPFYNGFGVKGLASVKYRNIVQFGCLADFSRLCNRMRGVNAINSTSINFNLKIGL